jgi:hypothetical protein
MMIRAAGAGFTVYIETAGIAALSEQAFTPCACAAASSMET